jgi:hypothetical protein
MPLLQVRNFPQDVYDEIALVAREERRTIAQQTIVLLQRALNQRQSDAERLKSDEERSNANMERRRKVLERIAAREVPEAVRAFDYVKAIREDRDR